MKKKILIIGGVAGGAGAAARLRRLSEEDEIIMFEKDPYMSFANCGLPYYIGNVIKDRDKLLVQKSSNFMKRFNVDVREYSEVTKIDPKEKSVTVYNHQKNEEYKETYDKIVISTGARAFIPEIKSDSEFNNMFTLKNIPDTDAIYEYIKNNNVKNALVIGAGFIGVETAENLAERGIKTTLVDAASKILDKTIDREFANILQEELTNKGINLITCDYVTEINKNGKEILTKNGTSIKTDLIIMSAGIRPNTEIAINAGLKAHDKSKHIIVDDNFKTSDNDIYAVGDAILVKSSLYKTNIPIPLAWPANRHARLVADAINGKKINNKPIYGASIIKVFDQTYASVGITEEQAKELNYDYEVVYAQRGSHAGYYPNSSTVHLKAIYDKKDGRILGAAGVGTDGIDKRVDVIATSMSYNGKITDLSSIELCYAPPFNSAKDPINILGYIGENVFNKDYKVIQWHEIDKKIKEGGFLLDVRTDVEFNLGSIKGATNIELDVLRDNLDKLPNDKNKDIYVNCAIGHRAYLAIKILINNGYKNVYNLTGGYKIYSIGMSYIENNKKCNIANNATKSTKTNKTRSNASVSNTIIKLELDCSGMQCPGPLLETKKAVDKLGDGETVKITSTDLGYGKDIEKWCINTGNTLTNLEATSTSVAATIKKGDYPTESLSDDKDIIVKKDGDATTIVCFSGDFDKIIATLIIANGAAAMNHKVSIFFTFWGLNALRRPKKVKKLNKSASEKMFSGMMPRGYNKTKISNMNMFGAGTKMIKKTMKKKNVLTLDEMFDEARKAGIQFIACTMSMDLMGIRKEELIDGCTLAGVGAYLGDATNSNVTLFV